jgi:hypothetical protein
MQHCLPPHDFQECCCQLFELFMMMCMITYMYATQAHTKHCDVFLQSYEPQSFNFYGEVGFVQINEKYDVGCEFLPKHLRCILWNLFKSSRQPGECLFHSFTKFKQTKHHSCGQYDCFGGQEGGSSWQTKTRKLMLFLMM